MKNVMIAAAIMLLNVTGLSAQNKPGTSLTDKAWVRINTEMLNVELGLNESQKADVLRIDERFEKKHDEMMAVVPKPTAKQVSDNAERLMKERDSALQTVLNTEQYAKWEKKRHKGTSELQKKEEAPVKK